MSGEIKELQIPDLWFDFYARLLPGTAFVALVRELEWPERAFPDSAEIFVLFACGYIVALIIQPVGSLITEGIECLAACCYRKITEAEVDMHVLQRVLGTTSRNSMILAKMHGETTFFCQLFLLGLTYLALVIVDCKGCSAWVLLTPVAALLLAFEVACRRLRRARSFKAAWDKYPGDGRSGAA